MQPIIEVKNLSKKYKDFTAVDGINFSVQAGEIFGILGPNGAGKTTTLEMIEGLKPITSGEAFLDGHNVAKQTRLIKSLIGVQLQSSSFFDDLSLKELLETFASLYNRQVDGLELLREVQLEDKSSARVKELSGGQKQRFSIAAALVNDPKVLFLDEPTTGLDPQARRNLWDLVMDINKKGKTVVITTHYMDEAEILCDRIAIMDNAKIVAMDKTENLLKLQGLFTTLHFNTDKPSSVESLKQVDSITHAEVEGHSYKLTTSNAEASLPSLFRYARENGLKLMNLQVNQPTLEDVFLKLTGHALRD